LNELNLRRVNIAAIKQHWPDMLQVAGSLVTNQVRAYDLIRMMTAEGRITSLGRAFAHYGRIFKSMHLLHVAHLEDYRRMMGAQLNGGTGSPTPDLRLEAFKWPVVRLAGMVTGVRGSVRLRGAWRTVGGLGRGGSRS
jgi:hypothetical protein